MHEYEKDMAIPITINIDNEQVSNKMKIAESFTN